MELKTGDPLPYLALAKNSLEHGDYQEAIRLSQTFLEIILESGEPADTPRFSAQVYEFLGLAEIEQNGLTEATVNYLKEGASLDPKNKRMQDNYVTAVDEAERKDLETSRLTEGHKRMSEWFDAL